MGFRVALDAQGLTGKKTGIGQYAAELIQALTLLNDGNCYLPLDWGRDPVMRTDHRLHWQQLALPRRVRAARADILHVMGYCVPIWRPCRVVATLHDLKAVLFPNNIPPVGRLYWSRWQPFSMRFADHLIVPSTATARDVVRLLGIPAGRITVIPNGLLPIYRPISDAQGLAELRAQQDLPERFILYVGTMEPGKGLDTLIEAYARLRGQTTGLQNVALVIAGGKGWLIDSLFEQVKSLGLEAQVRFLGYVKQADLPALYNLAQVLVLPSRYEGFGLPLAEGMACGTPVIYAANSSMPEVCGDAGLAFETDNPEALASALADVLTQPELATRLRELGLRQAARYTWERTARETVSVYERVIHP